MSMMPVLVLGPAVVFLWEERSKETKGVQNQASGPCNTPLPVFVPGSADIALCIDNVGKVVVVHEQQHPDCATLPAMFHIFPVWRVLWFVMVLVVVVSRRLVVMKLVSV